MVRGRLYTLHITYDSFLVESTDLSIFNKRFFSGAKRTLKYFRCFPKKPCIFEDAFTSRKSFEGLHTTLGGTHIIFQRHFHLFADLRYGFRFVLFSLFFKLNVNCGFLKIKPIYLSEFTKDRKIYAIAKLFLQFSREYCANSTEAFYKIINTFNVFQRSLCVVYQMIRVDNSFILVQILQISTF